MNIMAHEDLIQALNQQLNREVTTFLRYMLQGASIKGASFEPVRQMYLQEVTDEVGHAQYLANQIRMLGGRPVLKPDLSPPPEDVKEMLRRDIGEEKVDVQNYVRLAGMAESAGLYSLKLQMEQQAADEDEHGIEMNRLLG
jgi:bacterioferritin